jgi:hypothetical protein
MKLARTHLLWIALGLGAFLILYSLLRYFVGIKFEEGLEKIIIDGVIFASLGLFVYNRKLAADEKKERGEGGAGADEGTT